MGSQPADIALRDLPALPLDERGSLPQTAAIYFVLAGDEVLYIGRASSLWGRWRAHHRLDQVGAYGSCRIAWLAVDDPALLEDLEQACIAHFHPVLNGMAMGAEEALRKGRRISVQLDMDVAEGVIALALRDRRSISSAVNALVAEALEARASRDGRRAGHNLRHAL